MKTAKHILSLRWMPFLLDILQGDPSFSSTDFIDEWAEHLATFTSNQRKVMLASISEANPDVSKKLRAAIGSARKRITN